MRIYPIVLAGIQKIEPDDGTFIVGDGSDWVGESGDTARTSLGLGTEDSPTFTDLVLAGDTSVISSAHEIEIKPEGTTTHYCQFGIGNYPAPSIKSIGNSGHIEIESDNAAEVSLLFYEDVQNFGQFNWNKTSKDLRVASTSSLFFMMSRDWDDYIELKTVGGVPEITTVGNANLKITASSGVIDFDNEDITGTGTHTWLDGSSTNANTAYAHSQDNSQAHTDYLINNGNDESAGTLRTTNLVAAKTGTRELGFNTTSGGIATLYSDAASLIYMKPKGTLVGYFSDTIAFACYNDKIFKLGQSGANYGYLKYTAGTDTMNIGVVGTTTLKIDDNVDITGTINTTADQNWDLGAASAQADFAGDTKIRVTIGGTDYDIVAKAV